MNIWNVMPKWNECEKWIYLCEPKSSSFTFLLSVQKKQHTYTSQRDKERVDAHVHNSAISKYYDAKWINENMQIK